MASTASSSATPTPSVQVPDSSVLFARGVIARLSMWSTLRLVVQESWGGPGVSEKRTLLASEILDTFDTLEPPPDDMYIEDLLLQIMEEEFEVVVDDGSAESVARDIMKVWEEVKEGKNDTVLKYEKLAEKAESRRLEAVEKVVSDDEDSEGDDDAESDEDGDMEEEVPQLRRPVEAPRRDEPEVDEDGFTLVKSKSKSRR